MRRNVTIILFLLVTLLNCADGLAKSQTKNWGNLFNYAEYKNAKISPDGKHLAVAAQIQGKMGLVFLDRSKFKPVGFANFSGHEEVGDYHWVNNERVVIELVRRSPSSEAPSSYGELFAINKDGKKGKMIYGHRAGEAQTGSHIKKKKSTFGWGEIIDVLPEDEKYILISSTPMSNTAERLASVYKLNVYTGILKRKQGTSPVSFSRFVSDKNGKVRALVGTDKHNERQLYIKNEDGWKKLAKDTVGDSVYPLSVDATGKYLYTIDNFRQDLDGIFKLNLSDYSYKHVYSDSSVDISDVEMTTDGRSAYAIRVDENYPSYLILNKKVEEAKIFKELLQTFPQNKVSITSKTKDGNYYVVLVSSDIDAGSLYLFDKKENKVDFLFKFKPKFKRSDFSPVEPIQFNASDGQKIHGYFTPAKDIQDGAIAPVVVLVHGGPHGIRDSWSFDAEVQYLALNGYSVLQVNYRGSGGYGRNFEVSGHKVWGSIIQQDILDGYLWLVKQNKAELGNACIMGASFGAYSAVQSLAVYPDTYKCAIANAGIYDLELMFDEGDIRKRLSGMSYLKDVLGTNEQALKGMSPVNYVNKIQAPLLLAHGEDDERAPFEHAENLREALDKADKPYEWFAVDKEGHGFYNPDNQKAYMNKVVDFLDENLTK